jgi:hypothetical protein
LATGVVLDDFTEAKRHYLTGELVGDWTYDEARNSITFLSFTPDPLATVIIEYSPVDSID